MKSNLNCLATNCAYNNCGYCYASYIKIDGLDATNNSETNCDTFKQKSSVNNITSSFSENNITNSQGISCSAKNCTYNLYGACNATHVLINKELNKCDTFRVKN